MDPLNALTIEEKRTLLAALELLLDYQESDVSKEVAVDLARRLERL